jgi:hypothetical protein
MANSFFNMLMAIPLVLGGHELGHFKSGREAGISMQFRNNAATALNGDNNQKARMFGGGFEGQDLGIALGKEFGVDDKMPRLLSGLNKLGYGIFPNGLIGKKGDTSNVGRVKGKEAQKAMQAALILSGISDVLKSQGKGLGPNKDLSFWMSNTGAPGLKFTQRF